MSSFLLILGNSGTGNSISVIIFTAWPIIGANMLPNAAATKVATNVMGEKAASITGATISACLNKMKMFNLIEWILIWL